MLLRQLSYALKNQLKAPKAPYKGLWDEMPPTRGISCLSLVLYGIRIGGWLPLEMEYISSVGNIILTVDLTHNMLLLIPAFTLSRLGCRTEQSLVCGYLDAGTASV